ncbi:M48 family metalloprotease [Deltaproteobacteria bacterium OttesenSCG-928-K17]|nr:M48 family metalloprotease [Deltaproteobacteria bacterium OttesenSCG-928-K17]
MSFKTRLLVLTISLALILPWPMVAWAEPVNPQKERELGQRFHLKIAASGALFDDPITLKHYKTITDRIMRGAGMKADQYQFFIVRSDGINAFAVPGGYIYMHTETIISLENEGQLASILGHEVAHITSRHFARRVEAASSMSIAYLAGMLAGIFIASQGGDAAAALGQATVIASSGAVVQNMLANSRDDEAEADAKGRGYLTKAGYNPRDMYGAFRIMANKTYQTSKDFPTYLSTHPALTSRLATTFKDYENAPPAPPDYVYQAFKDRVLALTGEKQRVRNIFTKRTTADKNDHSAWHGLGLLAASEQRLTEADQLMTTALKLAPSNREYLADLGDLALRRRKPDEAKKYYEKAGQNNRQVVLGLARATELLGEKTKAGKYYDQAVNMDKTPYPEALELASRFFGHNGQKGKGYYYTARYFNSKGDLDKAIFHYKEAAKQPDAGQYKAIAEREIKILTDIKETDKK